MGAQRRQIVREMILVCLRVSKHALSRQVSLEILIQYSIGFLCVREQAKGKLLEYPV